MGTYALSASTINNSGTVETQNTTSTPLPAGLTWGGTVQYNDGTTSGQTVVTGAYDNLILSGSGVKTIASGTSISGNLSIAPTGNATASLGNNNFNASTLTLGGTNQPTGTYGSTAATSATYKLSTYFGTSGTGVLTVYAGTPTVTISAATPISSTTATLNGNITANGGVNPTVTFYWGTTNGLQNPANWKNYGTATYAGGIASFSLNIGSLSPNTKYYFSAAATNTYGTSWPVASLNFTTVEASGDFDGDGKTDVSIYRSNTGWWYVDQSSNSQMLAVDWGGEPGDIPVPGDYEGDGITDFAIYRPSNGYWYIRLQNGQMRTVYWGGEPGDIPVPGDYDGDGKTDVAIYRSTTGWWYIDQSSNSQMLAIDWGGESGDIPVPGDYEGNGITDVAIYRSTTGWWYINQSNTGEMQTAYWGGESADIPLPGYPNQ
jgi:hypothetical protein